MKFKIKLLSHHSRPKYFYIYFFSYSLCPLIIAFLASNFLCFLLYFSSVTNLLSLGHLYTVLPFFNIISLENALLWAVINNLVPSDEFLTGNPKSFLTFVALFGECLLGTSASVNPSIVLPAGSTNTKLRAWRSGPTIHPLTVFLRH